MPNKERRRIVAGPFNLMSQHPKCLDRRRWCSDAVCDSVSEGDEATSVLRLRRGYLPIMHGLNHAGAVVFFAGLGEQLGYKLQ